MRTVDPELWARRLHRPGLVTSRLRPGMVTSQLQPGLERTLRASMRDAAAEYWQHCSIGFVKYMKHDDVNNKYKKWRNLLLVLLTFALGCAALADGTLQYQSRPPLYVQKYAASVAHAPFPAVAICSNKVISRAALRNLTRHLYTAPTNQRERYQYSEAQIEDHLLKMGALLSYAYTEVDFVFTKFIRESMPQFNITDIMYRFSANCSTILVRCSWRGKVQNCEHMFATRLTALGFCCVFNSRYQAADFGRQPLVLNKTGKDFGLGVVLHEVQNDFAYMRRPAYGMEVLLFEGSEFPIVESGDVRVYPLPINASVYFNIQAVTQQPTDEVGSYSEPRRGCRLGRRGASQCLADCRRDTAEALCKCVPYTLQPQFEPRAAATCTLNELACLNKHREKFMYVYPGEVAHESLQQEQQDSMECDCAVPCGRQLYRATISYSYYRSKPRVFQNFLTRNMSLQSTTSLRLFYGVDRQQWYKMEVFSRLSDVCVKLSCQWMAITGITLVSCWEVVYHATYRCARHVARRLRAPSVPRRRMH
ncbi:sodium channel protein Nach-like [Spodoptera litura]|uniref:Sodium channel protein Nach-like n=1 Tax=Spodoptera litura TaxID=69820 RepID=A0A9J7IKH6_SPOLT|nr:sodium channel protein Nach-like [Spodoptera litura]